MQNNQKTVNAVIELNALFRTEEPTIPIIAKNTKESWVVKKGA